MKAFLSHSSKDKLIVERVADSLGLANIIIDSRSFDFGIDNTSLINDGLDQCDLFVLFLSKNSLLSKYVDLEAKLAEKLIKAGHLDKFLTVCLDDTSFADAKPFIKRFNAVRKITSPNAISRRICAELIALDAQSTRNTNIFIGRDREINDLQDQLIDPHNSRTSSIFVSGITGIGRRSFVQQVFRRVFPAVNTVFPTIIVEENDGSEEIYRKLISINTPFEALADATMLFNAFGSSIDDEKSDLTSRVIRDIVEQRETVIFLDGGGLLLDDGSINPVVSSICDRAPTTHHPSIICISQRAVPARVRNDIPYMIFAGLKALPDTDCRKVIGLLFRQQGIQYSSLQLDELVAITDGHPHNIHMVVKFCKQYGTDAFINDPSELISWKHKRGYEYIQQFQFDETESIILSLLADFPRLESGMLFEAASTNTANVAAGIRRLIDLNVVDVIEGDYILSPPMRIAVERDERFQVEGRQKLAAIRTIAKAFVAIEPTDPVNGSLIEGGILAALYSGEALPSHLVALTLPSQHVWLAQRLYDRKDYRGALKKAQEALAGRSRLSHDGTIEAFRIVCLSASRLGDQPVFDKYIRSLSEVSKSRRDVASTEFLRGFNARMSGNFPDAEMHFRSAFDKNLRNYSLLRELSSLLVSSGRHEEGEQYARKAYEIAPDNPFVVDILVGCLIGRGRGASTSGQAEISALMDRLKQVEGDDMSFYNIRMAEISLYQGNIDEAAKMARASVKRTPWMFSAHRLLAEIELRRRNFSAVTDEIKAMQSIIDDPNNTDRKSGLRNLLEVKIQHLTATGDYDSAKNTYRSSAFSEADKAQGLREVDFAKARTRSDT